MAVGAVAERLAGDAAEADLEQLEPFAVLARPRVAPRIHQVRRGRETGGAEEFRRALAEQAAEDIEDPPERMSAARQRRGVIGLEQ